MRTIGRERFQLPAVEHVARASRGLKCLAVHASAFACVLGITGVALAQDATWTELGPGPITAFSRAVGRVSAIAVHPTDPNRYYIAGADGGVWRSTNAGSSWTPLTDHLPTTTIGALALDSTSPSVLYAGSGEANFANHSRYGLGLYKSTDGGDSWRVLAASTFSGRCFSNIVISPADRRTLYAAITHAGGFPALAAAKGHPQASGPVGLFRSIDAGETWSLIEGLPAIDATDVCIDPADPNVIYAAIGNIFGSPSNGVYRSADGGMTWSRLAMPGSPLGRIGLAASTSTVFAYLVNPADSAGGNGTMRSIARSTNGGATWTLGPSLDSSGYNWYFARLAVNPSNQQQVLAGALSLSRSTDAGGSFTAIGPPHPDVHAIAWDAAGRLLVGCDGGIYRSANNLGTDWVSLNQNLGLVQIYAGLSTHPTDERIFLAGLQDNGSAIRTTPAADLTWRSIAGGDGGWTQISHHDPNVMFVESQGTGAISRSTNGGLSFSPVGSGLVGRNCFLPPFVIDPATPGRMLYGTERVWVSINNGSTFSPLSGDLTSGGTAAIRALAIAPSSSLYVYAATNDGRVLSSADGGSTFITRLTDNPGWPRVTRELFVHPFEPATVYLAGAVFGQPHVRRSLDAGTTWETLDGNLPDTPINVIGIDHRGLVPVLYAGGDGGVWRSADDGITWRRFGAGLPHANVVDLHVEPARSGSGRLVVATQGRGAWLIPLPCPADFDGDGFIDAFDYARYVVAFESGDIGSDTNADGFLDAFDYEAFVSAFEVGC